MACNQCKSCDGLHIQHIHTSANPDWSSSCYKVLYSMDTSKYSIYRSSRPIRVCWCGSWYWSSFFLHQQTLFLAAVGCTGLWRHLKPTEERIYWLCRPVQPLKTSEVHKICWCTSSSSPLSDIVTPYQQATMSCCQCDPWVTCPHNVMPSNIFHLT